MNTHLRILSLLGIATCIFGGLAALYGSWWVVIVCTTLILLVAGIELEYLWHTKSTEPYPELVEYIHNSTKEVREIEQELLQAGWQPEIIEQYLR